MTADYNASSTGGLTMGATICAMFLGHWYLNHPGMRLEPLRRLLLLIMVPFLVPFNLLLYGLENLMFLLFPTPLVPVGRVDFDFLGRTMVEFSVKTALLLGGCGLAAAAGTVVLNATGRNWSAFAVVTWWVLMLVALLLLPLMSRAYSRFDISRG